jgi:hypothetical protein
MTGPEPRTAAQRKLDTLAKLTAPAADGWVATAGDRAHLVPLSIAWIDERIVLAVEARSVTARNLVAGRAARVGLGATRDVVMIDTVLDASHDVAGAPAAIADGYAAQSDWDPRSSPEGYVYHVLRPERVQAWTEVHELPGRTIMRAGEWLI